MTEPDRKLEVLSSSPSPHPLSAPVCPTTGLTVPECSCQRCALGQIRAHAPWIVDPRLGPSGQDRRAA